jgi:glycosyltransferase involved in cell wall biosynthesis
MDVLVVGVAGKRAGGIAQYIAEQQRHIDDVDLRVYDTHTDADGGIFSFLCAVLVSLWTVLAFPFQRRPDVVHVHTSHRFSFYRSSLYVLVAAYLWRRPVVLHVHGSSFDEFALTDSYAVAALQRVVFDASDRVIVLSEYWKDVLSHKVDEEKLAVLPNAVDTSDYSPSFDHEKPHVVFVSNHIERKGIVGFVDAVDRLKRNNSPPFRVSIAGDGPLSDHAAELCETHDDAEYLGYVSEERKQSLLEAASIYVLPTYAEGLPIALLEGMAGGNAVVTTDVGSIPEVVGDRNGRIVTPGNVDELKDALTALVDDHDTAVNMGETNYELVSMEYAWTTVSGQLVDLYESVDAAAGDYSRS